MVFSGSDIKSCREDLAELRMQYGRLEQEDWDVQMQTGDLFESVKQEMNELIEGRYSRAVFDLLAVRNPRLIRLKTRKTVRWEEVFGYDYEQTTPAQRREMVGLVEGKGEYRLKYRILYRF